MTTSVKVIQTGSVKIRSTAYHQPANRSVLRRRLRFLADRQWHPTSLPIYSFLITHPEGNILFDTGMSPNCNQSNYFPVWGLGTKMATQMHIEAHEGMASQLQEMGIGPNDLKAIVLSHLHHDHTGGLEDLAEAPIFMSKEHWEAFKGPTYAAMEGCAPNHWPKNFVPKFLEPTGKAIGPFERSYPITSDGKVVAVDTPGHAPGHVSLIVFADDATFFLTGDATYSLELLDKENTDGINDDPLRAVETLKQIKEFARQQPVVVLPSHDTKTIENLKLKIAFTPSDL